jgi:MFS family permease
MRPALTDTGKVTMTTNPIRQVHRWRAFAVLAVAFFMTTVDLTVVNVALPTIGRKLHFSESDLQWVVTAYGITFGGFLLLGGRAADLLGRRRILMLGLAVFSAASLAAGLATSGGFLIAMRGLQGLGAAVVLPAALSIVMNMFAEGAERNKALGLWGGIAAAGGTVGLIAGGLLTRYAGWQYIFFVNVPVGGQTSGVALTGGFHWALWVCGTIALLALPAAAALLRRNTAPDSLEGAVQALATGEAIEVNEILR